MSSAEKNEGVAPVNTQPQQIAPMAVGGNKNALIREVGADGKRDWSYDLIDTNCPCNLFLLACFCPCFFFGKTKQRLSHLEDRGVPLPDGGDKCDGEYCLYCCGFACGFRLCLQVPNRSDVRRRYGIRGGCMGDCLASWCCDPCALVQERRELELEEGSLR
ncbi:PLAC8 family-domain-containing protein [Russula compacta]|nr:PLAC8 family-domain-containing protein [Russula compacta]